VVGLGGHGPYIGRAPAKLYGNFLIRAAPCGGTVCTMPGGIGPLELIIVLVIVLVIFGPKRLPGLGRSLGRGLREFKDSVTGKDRDRDGDEHRALEPGQAAAAPSQPVQAEGERPEREVSGPRA
jgi:sec-independent protein translocase protein TatA